jgi:hypothetical protein
MSHSKKKQSEPKANEPAREPEVIAMATKRQFSKAYKLRILEEADRCTQSGEIGALLRREGLYSSHLTRWLEPNGFAAQAIEKRTSRSARNAVG